MSDIKRGEPMNYNFSQDLEDGTKAEKRVAELFQTKCKQIVSVDYNHDYKYDLRLTLDDSRSFTVEVKCDYLLQRTGNFAIETKCRGKASGINVTQADFFVIYTSGPEHAYTFKTDHLRKLAADPKYRTVSGGDRNKQGEDTTEMVLIPKCLTSNYRDITEMEEIDL